MKNRFEELASVLFKNLLDEEQASLSLYGENTFFTRINQSKIRQNIHVEQAEVELVYKHNQRSIECLFPFGKDTAINQEKALKMLLQCRENARQIPPNPFYVPLSETHQSFEEHPGNFPKEEQWFENYLPLLQDVDAVGLLTAGSVIRANMNSLGQNHWYQGDSFCFDLSFYTAHQKAVKILYSGNVWSVDEFMHRLENAKIQLKMLDQPSRKIEPGCYRTYFAPDAAASLISFVAGSVGAAAYHQGHSPLKDLIEQQKDLSSLFTLYEDFTQGFGPRFNSLGEFPTQQIPVIEKGQLQNLLISTQAAMEYQLESNQAEPNERLRYPSVFPGNIKENDILKTLDTGIYVSNVHYLNWSDQIKGRITGMTRYACFWVEKGEIISPIQDLRFDETLYRFLGPQLLELTDATSVIGETDSYFMRQIGGMSVPGLFVEDFTYTL